MRSCHLFPPLGYPNLLPEMQTNKLAYQSSSLAHNYLGLPTQIEKILWQACTFLSFDGQKSAIFCATHANFTIDWLCSVFERRV